MTAPPPPPPKHSAPPALDDKEGTGEPLLRPTTTNAVPGGVGVSIGGGLRKKAVGVKPWLLLDSTGQAQVVDAGKHAIMRRTGLPARDLRILDPLLSYPSTVLGRERAIVINLEHIKAIITAQEVLLLNSRDPSVAPFVEKLQRRIFRHHQAIMAQVRDELEHLLDDDEDMAEMYLTEKLAEQQLENSSAASLNEQDDMDEAVQSEMDDRVPAEISMEGNGVSFISDGDLQQIDNRQEQFFGGPVAPSRNSHGTHTGTHSAIGKHLDVEELEMLLEAYFVQIDGTLNKLSTLREYVDDTEDYINIMLDDKQNHLLQMGVILTTATLVVSSFVVVTAIFGMNIKIELFNPNYAGMPQFLWTVGGGTAGCVFLYVIAISWCKHRRLLE